MGTTMGSTLQPEQISGLLGGSGAAMPAGQTQSTTGAPSTLAPTGQRSLGQSTVGAYQIPTSTGLATADGAQNAGITSLLQALYGHLTSTPQTLGSSGVVPAPKDQKSTNPIGAPANNQSAMDILTSMLAASGGQNAGMPVMML